MRAIAIFIFVVVPVFWAVVALVLFAISLEPKDLVLALVLGVCAALSWLFFKAIFSPLVKQDDSIS